VDEVELGNRQYKGAKATELLGSDLLRDTFGYLEKEYLQAWRNSAVKDEKGRENLFLAIRVLDHVRSHLHKLVADGKIASKDLANIKYLKR
jgi:hypothetical protein